MNIIHWALIFKQLQNKYLNNNKTSFIHYEYSLNIIHWALIFKQSQSQCSERCVLLSKSHPFNDIWTGTGGSVVTILKCEPGFFRPTHRVKNLNVKQTQSFSSSQHDKGVYMQDHPQIRGKSAGLSNLFAKRCQTQKGNEWHANSGYSLGVELHMWRVYLSIWHLLSFFHQCSLVHGLQWLPL